VLNQTIFDSMDKNKLSSQLQNETIKNIIKDKTGYDKLDDISIKLVADNDQGTLKITITHYNGSESFVLKGFKSQADFDQEEAQAKIDKAVKEQKPSPKIKTGSEQKTAAQAQNDDFEVPTVEGLTFAITQVEKSTTITDGTTATVTVKVSAGVKGTEPKTYSVEVKDFKSQFQADIENLQNSLQTLSSKTSLPSTITHEVIKDKVQDFAKSISGTIVVVENSFKYND
jgi:hypothetical protein